MEDDAEEIARIFAAELADLDNSYDSDGEEDQSLRQLEELGAQLRQSIDEQNRGDDDDWQALVQSTKSESSRLKDIEEVNTAVPVQHARSPIAKKKKRSKSPDNRKGSPTSSSPKSPEPKEVKFATVDDDPEMQEEIKIDAKSAADEERDKNVILDLMDSMLTAVGMAARLTAPKVTEKAQEVKADLSSLPQMLVDEEKTDEMTKGSDADMEISGYVPNSAQKSGDLQEQERVREALKMMEEAELRLKEEEEESAIALKVDRKQRAERRQRMVEEMMRAKRDKAVLRLQTICRGMLARKHRKVLMMEAVVEASRIAEAERAELELKQRIADEEQESIEIVNMSEADLERKEFITAESFAQESEIELFYAEEPVSLLLRSESYVVNYQIELQDVADRIEITEYISDDIIPRIEENIEQERMAIVKEKEDNIANASMCWGFYNTAYGSTSQDSSQEKPEEYKALALSSSEYNIYNDAQHCWAHFNKLHPIDKDFDELGIFSFDLNAFPHVEKEDDESEHDEVFGVYNDNDNENSDSDKEFEGIEAKDSDDEINISEIIDVTKASRRAMPRQKKRVKVDTVLSIYSKEKESDSLQLNQHWKSLARAAVVNSTIDHVDFSAHHTDVASVVLQKNISFAFVSQPENHQEQTQILSPRARVGMRVVSSRNSTGVSNGNFTDNNIILSEDLRNNAAAVENNNQLDTKTFCPLNASLSSWKENREYATSKLSTMPIEEADYSSAEKAGIDMQRLDALIADTNTTKDSKKIKSNNNANDDDGADDENDDDYYEKHEKLLEQLGLRGNPSNVTFLELGVEGLHTSAFLIKFCNLRKLQLNVNRLCTLDGLRKMKKLEELSVKDNALINIEALKHTKKIKKLHLDANKLTNLDPLQSLPELSILSASTNNLTEMPELIECHKLQKLELYHNQISEVSEKSLQDMKSLMHLDLGRNKLEYISGDALSHCCLLQTLILSQNSLLEVPSPLHLPQLRTLWLSGNRLEDLQGWVPSKSETNSFDNWPVFSPLLEKLFLQDNRIFQLNAKAMLVFPNLSEIDVSFNNIDSIENMSGVALCPRLQSLQIQENPVSTSAATSEDLLVWIHYYCSSIVSISRERYDGPKLLCSTQSRNDALSESLLQTYYGTNQWSMSSDYYPVAKRTDHEIETVLSTLGIQKLGTHPPSCPYSSELLQIFLNMIVQQNAYRNEEKFQKRKVEREKVELPSSIHEDVYVQLLHDQLETIKSYKMNRDFTESSKPPGVLHYQSAVDKKRTNNLAQPKSKKNIYKGKNRYQVRKIAAVSIQAVFRGSSGRSALQNALNTAQYNDQEMDDMFLEMDGANGELNMDEFLSAPELDDGYFNNHRTREIEVQAVVKSVEHQTDDINMANLEQESPRKPMVYGDHRRRKSKPTADEAQVLRENNMNEQADRTPKVQSSAWTEEEVYNAFGSGEQEEGEKSGTEGYDTSVRVDFNPSTPGEKDMSPRPMSAMTDASETSGAAMSAVMDDDMPEMYPYNKGGETQSVRSGASGASKKASSSLMAQEWGISDPKVLAMIQKRSQRLQLGASSTNTSTKTASGQAARARGGGSGAFGGKPSKPTRGNNKTKGRKGAPPAWAKPAPNA